MAVNDPHEVRTGRLDVADFLADGVIDALATAAREHNVFIALTISPHVDDVETTQEDDTR